MFYKKDIQGYSEKPSYTHVCAGVHTCLCRRMYLNVNTYARFDRKVLHELSKLSSHKLMATSLILDPSTVAPAQLPENGNTNASSTVAEVPEVWQLRISLYEL